MQDEKETIIFHEPGVIHDPPSLAKENKHIDGSVFLKKRNKIASISGTNIPVNMLKKGVNVCVVVSTNGKSAHIHSLGNECDH
ncbi:MAG: hypothetical protein OEX02_06790 [Cyclobacteriaceae bacterium]|nr:hypothetical protein [Cyclobacteriaceae bacterium]